MDRWEPERQAGVGARTGVCASPPSQTYVKMQTVKAGVRTRSLSPDHPSRFRGITKLAVVGAARDDPMTCPEEDWRASEVGVGGSETSGWIRGAAMKGRKEWWRK